jgi:hypothetical protein
VADPWALEIPGKKQHGRKLKKQKMIIKDIDACD